MRISFLICLIIPIVLKAQFTVAPYFSDNMVLQRDQPIHIWGKASPGIKISVSLLNQKKSTIVQSDSSWDIYLNPTRANSHPSMLIVQSGAIKKIYENVLIGDVWLCIGQSNMLFSMREEMHYKAEVKNAKQPLLHFYNPTYIGKDIYNQQFSDSMLQRLNKENFYSQASWNPSDSQYFSSMTAVGYYFGKELVNDLNIPIGLINLSIGGAPIETFINQDVLKKDKRAANKVNGNWINNNAIPAWVRARATQNVGGLLNAPYDNYGPSHAFKPGFAFNAGINPLTKFPIKGVIWYQGESNAQEIESVNEYGELFALMVNDYRNKWALPKLPFYFAQLSSIDTINYKGQLWHYFREEQRKLVQTIKYTGMAVTSDIGFRNNVHPTNKKLVGERLALLALDKTYARNIISSGPVPIEANYINNEIIVKFKYAKEGLLGSDGSTIKGFSVNGANSIDAVVKKNKIFIKYSTKPQFVYYGWQPFSTGNLINKKVLPTSTFKIFVK